MSLPMMKVKNAKQESHFSGVCGGLGLPQARVKVIHKNIRHNFNTYLI